MLTRVSRKASDRVTAVIAFGGNINEIQGGNDYSMKSERLEASGEHDLAALFGAFVTQIFILHGDWIHTVVIGLILVALIYLQRDRLRPGSAPR